MVNSRHLPRWKATLFCAFVYCFWTDPAQAQVQMGSGSYVNSGNFTVPSVNPYVTQDFVQKAISNKWWSTLITTPFSQPLFAHPCSYRAVAGGLEMGYPGGPSGGGTNFSSAHVADLTIGIQSLNALDARVSSHSHFAVTARWESGNLRMEATMGQGLPFAYFIITGGPAQISFSGTPTVWADNGNALGVTVNGRHYGIFAPAGAVWTGTGTRTSTLAGQDYLSVALLPDNTVTTLQFFQTYAYSFVTNTRVTWNYNESNARLVTTFSAVTDVKEGSQTETLFAMMRHHWLNSGQPSTAYTYTSARGEMRVTEGSSFSATSVFNGVLLSMPEIGVNLNTLGGLVQNETAPTIRGTTYNKDLGKYAQLVQIAHMTGQTAKRDQFLDRLKESLQEWLTAGGQTQFYYHNAWNRLIGYPAAYGSDERLSDHHFHYGYFLKAAAVVAQWDPAWATQGNWGGMVEMLIRDVNAWDDNDPLFGRFAAFEPYEGHGWADGMGFDRGNNQESSSESMNFNSSLILWGVMTGNTVLRDMGIFMYVNETAAIEQYWWDVDNAVFPAAFNHSAIGIVWSNGGDYATWFSANTGHIHGINFLPMTAGHLYIGRVPGYIPTNYNEGYTGTWADLFYEFLAFSDGPGALSNYSGSTGIEGGNTRAATYLHLNSLAAAGQLNTEIVGDAATFAVFDTGNQRAYTAFNPDNTPRTVSFNDGFSMTVPSRSQITQTGPVLPPLGLRFNRVSTTEPYLVKHIIINEGLPPGLLNRPYHVIDVFTLSGKKIISYNKYDNIHSEMAELDPGLYVLKIQFSQP